MPQNRPIHPSGFTFHGAIHASLPDAHCVMHVHTTPTLAVRCTEEGLSFSKYYAAQLWGQVAYHDFEGITVHREEGARILASAARGHDGPFPSDPNPRGGRDRPADPSRLQGAKPVLAGCVRDSLNFNPNFGTGEDSFAAMQRQINRIDPGYRA